MTPPRPAGAARDWKVDPGFDVDGFLARPLVARVATAGPTVRPVWYLWENEASWDRRRFLEGTFADPSARFARLAPRWLRARDLSFAPSRSAPSG